MADKKISELSAAATLAGTESVELVQSAANVKGTVAGLAAFGTDIQRFEASGTWTKPVGCTWVWVEIIAGGAGGGGGARTASSTASSGGGGGAGGGRNGALFRAADLAATAAVTRL